MQSDEASYFILRRIPMDWVALEKMKVPENITVICGQGTYALGIIVNTTLPSRLGRAPHLGVRQQLWSDCRIYANEGICQLLFFEGDPCDTTYKDRSGKYQHQPERVTLAGSKPQGAKRAL